MSHRGVFLWKKPHKFGILLTYLYLCGAKINSFMYFTGIIIAVMTFLTIGIWHPIVSGCVRGVGALGHRRTLCAEEARGEGLVSEKR